MPFWRRWPGTIRHSTEPGRVSWCGSKKKTGMKLPEQSMPVVYSATTVPDEAPLAGTGARSASGTR